MTMTTTEEPKPQTPMQQELEQQREQQDGVIVTKQPTSQPRMDINNAQNDDLRLRGGLKLCCCDVRFHAHNCHPRIWCSCCDGMCSFSK
ncbi:hypothetical protein VTJ83DRAFT_7538 [Remersonia thermophila]|uniref:Uncharacterized protein n=1 Tax=Remersonia thermophila TaxID=72144 RepID=A0ABR4D3S9_9PEZI